MSKHIPITSCGMSPMVEYVGSESFLTRNSTIENFRIMTITEKFLARFATRRIKLSFSDFSRGRDAGSKRNPFFKYHKINVLRYMNDREGGGGKDVIIFGVIRGEYFKSGEYLGARIPLPRWHKKGRNERGLTILVFTTPRYFSS